MRCIVKDCKNHEHEGKFVGSLCFPCHEYITKAEGRHSQAYRNTQRTWVGLTDLQKQAIKFAHSKMGMMMIDYDLDEMLEATEQALKEKNT